MGRPFLGVIMWKNAKYIGQFKGGYERDKDGKRQKWIARASRKRKYRVNSDQNFRR